MRHTRSRGASQACAVLVRTRVYLYQFSQMLSAANTASITLATGIVAVLFARRAGAPSSRKSSLDTHGPAAICIVSCDELIAAGSGDASPTWGTAGLDEVLLYDALRAQGQSYHVRSWTDESVNWASYRCVLIRTTWDYSKSEAHAWRFTRWLARVERALAPHSGRVLNDPRVIAWSTHKDYLPQLASAAATSGRAASPSPWTVAVVPQVVVRAGSSATVDLGAIMRAHGWRSVILKPAVGGGSRACLRVLASSGQVGIAEGQAFLAHHVGQSAAAATTASLLDHRSSTLRRLDGSAGSGVESPHAVAVRAAESMSAAADALRTDIVGGSDAGCDMLIQPYLTSVSQGEVSVLVIDGAVSHVVTKQPVPGDFRCQEEFGAVATLLAERDPRLDELALACIHAAAHATASLQISLNEPSSPPAASFALSSPPLPILSGRVDFLRIDSAETHAEVFGVYEKCGRETTCLPALASPPRYEDTPLVLLECELIEPALFLKEAAAGGVDAAGALARALAHVVARVEQAGGASV